MTPSRPLRLILVSAVAATAIGAVSSAGPSVVLANDLCYSAGVSGTVTGTHDTPRLCEPTSLPVLCTTPSAGLSPTIAAHAEACVPD